MSGKTEKIELSSRKKSVILKQWNIYLSKIMPALSQLEQSLYTSLFWLTVGRGKRECSISYSSLRKLCNIMAERTVARGISHLIEKRYLSIISRGFRKPTHYKVFSPLEIITPDKYDQKSKKKGK